MDNNYKYSESNFLRFVLFLLFIIVMTSCSAQKKNHSTGVYMLLDTSGTYTGELGKALNITKYFLATLNPGDTFAVARIDTASFTEKDIVQKATFDDRPSVSNNQKRVFSQNMDVFVDTVKSSKYTDITGGVLQATEYLNEAANGQKVIIIFSDLKEEIKKGYVRDIPFNLDGYKVVALNVTKLRGDMINPKEYMDRLEDWRLKVEEGGGSWIVVNDLDRLERILAS